jgi:arylsulfatase A-like enzyme
VEGRSLVPLWRGEKQSLRDSLFLAFEGSQRAVREDRWKLIRYPHVNKTQLFDLNHDPHELIHLADDPAYAGHVETMMSLLLRWPEKAGDFAALTSADPSPAEIDLSGRPRKPDSHQPEWIVRKYFEGN